MLVGVGKKCRGAEIWVQGPMYVVQGVVGVGRAQGYRNLYQVERPR